MRWNCVGGFLLLCALVGGGAAFAEEPPAASAAPAERTVEQAARILADALVSQQWGAYEATLVTADDVRAFEETLAAATGMRDRDVQLAGMRAFIEKHGGYAGAAAQQRKDAVERAQKARADVPSDVDWATVTWGRPLSLRTRLVRQDPFEVREEWFSLRTGERELAFMGHVTRIRGGWTYLTGVEFRETIVESIAQPDLGTHPLAGLWAGVGAAAGARREVTLWLQPMEQAGRYIARMLSSRHEARGTGAWSSHAIGVTWGGAQLRWPDGSLALEGDVLRGRFEQAEIAVRYQPLDRVPAASELERELSLRLRGIAVVYAPDLVDVRRSTFDLGFESGEGNAVTIDVRAGDDGDSAVAALLRRKLKGAHTGSTIESLGGTTSYFGFQKLPHAGFFRLVHSRGDPFGPRPVIVHGYAPWK